MAASAVAASVGGSSAVSRGANASVISLLREGASVGAAAPKGNGILLNASVHIVVQKEAIFYYRDGDHQATSWLLASSQPAGWLLAISQPAG